jgi:hypothetical protein
LQAFNAFRNAPDRSLRGRLNRGIGYATNANKAGLNPRNWRGNLSEAASSGSLAQADAMMNDDDYNSWKNNDDLNMFASRSRNRADLTGMLRNSGMYNGPEGEENLRRDVSRVERMRKKYGNSAFRQATWQQAVAGGTAFQGADAWAAAADVAGNDNAVLANLVARGRSAAMGAGRVDQGGAGFMDTMRVAQQFRDNPNYTEAQGTADMARHVYNSQGAGVLTHASMKPQAVDNLIPEMQNRIAQAAASGNQDALDRELAFAANAYDGLAQTSPQLAERFGDQVLRWRPGAEPGQQDLAPGVAGPVQTSTPLPPGVAGPPAPRPQTVLEMIEGRRYTSDTFRSTRREYGSAQERDATGGGRPPQEPGAGAPTQQPGPPR